MTNREFFDYIRVCNSKIRNNNAMAYNIFLDSKASIKEVYKVLSKFNEAHIIICNRLCEIFEVFKEDKEREIALKLISKTLLDYDRYFNMNKRFMIDNVMYVVNRDGTNIKNIEHRLKLIDDYTGNRLRGESDKYTIQVFRPNNRSKCLDLEIKNNKDKSERVIKGIMAIIFKNGKYKIYKLEEEENIRGLVESLDYDLCIHRYGEDIVDELDERVEGWDND